MIISQLCSHSTTLVYSNHCNQCNVRTSVVSLWFQQHKWGPRKYPCDSMYSWRPYMRLFGSGRAVMAEWCPRVRWVVCIYVWWVVRIYVYVYGECCLYVYTYGEWRPRVWPPFATGIFPGRKSTGTEKGLTPHPYMADDIPPLGEIRSVRWNENSKRTVILTNFCIFYWDESMIKWHM